MPNLIRVLRSKYQSTSESSLNEQAGNVVTKCRASPVYDPLKQLVDNLDDKNKAYKVYLDLGKDSGKANTSLKVLAKKAVVDALNLVADKVDENANGDAAYIINAGFETYNTPERRRARPNPTGLKTGSTGEPGELRIEFEIPDLKAVVLNVIWLSFDNGETWTKDYYTKRKILVVTGLPSESKVLVRVKSIGTRDNTSQWVVAAKQALIL